MTYIYYSCIFFLIFRELRSALLPEKTLAIYQKGDKLLAKIKQGVELSKKERGELGGRIMNGIFGFLWLFIGLFTFQWKIFLLYFIFSFYVAYNKSFKEDVNFIRVDGIISIIFYLVILINGVHLHI